MRHPYHILTLSPWPIFMSLNLLSFMISMIGVLNGTYYSNKNLLLSLILLIVVLLLWFEDIILESNYIGNHTNKVSKTLLLGFLLFVLTEIMLFFSFFWAYFHSALNPYYLVWPPIGIELINPWSIPLLNTFLLLYSGIIATYAHHSFLNKNINNTINSIYITIFLGTLFFILQIFEYFNSTFNITDSVYGTTFFMLTGLHGLHIIAGVSFFLYTLYKLLNNHFSHLVFDIAILYWHVVDIVWILLFVLIYYMGY